MSRTQRNPVRQPAERPFPYVPRPLDDDDRAMIATLLAVDPASITGENAAGYLASIGTAADEAAERPLAAGFYAESELAARYLEAAGCTIPNCHTFH